MHIHLTINLSENNNNQSFQFNPIQFNSIQSTNSNRLFQFLKKHTGKSLLFYFFNNLKKESAEQ